MKHVQHTLSLTALLVGFMLAGLAETAAAHGGQYKGPSNAGGGGGAAPKGAPSSGGGGASLGGGGPGAGAPSSGSTGAPSRGSGSARGGRSRSSASAAVSMGYDGWEFWWESNRDRYITLKERVGRTVSQPGSPGRLTARGGRAAVSSERPDQTMIDQRIIPALEQVSKTADDRDILDSTVLAMGRSASPLTHDAAYEAAVSLLAHRELSVQSSAALSLGVLHATQAWPLLTGLVADDSAGRAAVGGGNVPWLVRSFACLALGLIGDARSVRTLMSTIDTLPDSERDVKASAIAALGLLPRSNALASTAESFLGSVLEKAELDPHIRSYIPTTLGKMGSASSIAPLLACFKDDHTENVVRQSAAIGLGQLSRMGDVSVLDALTGYISGGRDQQTRHFALISLAQIGGRDLDPSQHLPGHASLLKTLLREMGTKASSHSHRSWSALAAAIYGREMHTATPKIIEAIREGFQRERDPSFRGAFAISLALLDDQSSRTLIHEEFSRSHQEDFQGYAGEALGLLRHREASLELLKLCADRSISPSFRLKTATSLGLMGDRQAVPVLMQTLDEAGSLGGLASAASALGLIGDQTAVDPLLEMAADQAGRAASRAFACVALGLLGERSALPFNERLKAHNNYLAQLPSIAEVLRIL